MKKLLALTLALAWLAGFAACGTKPALANAPLSLGEKYLLDLDYDQAIAQLEEAIKIEPKNPRIQLLILYIYVHEDYPQEEIDGRLPKDYPFTPPVDDPNETPLGKKISWLLAIIDALRNLSIRDLALELLKRLAEEFSLEQRVSVALHGLADELGVVLEVTTGSVTTVAATTTEKPAATTEKLTSLTKATTKQANKVEISKMLYGPIDKLAKALGCIHTHTVGNDGDPDLTDYYKNESNGTVLVGNRRYSTYYAEYSYATYSIEWTSPTISFFGICVGDSLETSIRKIPSGIAIDSGYIDFYGGKRVDDGYTFNSAASDYTLYSDASGLIARVKMHYWLAD